MRGIFIVLMLLALSADAQTNPNGEILNDACSASRTFVKEYMHHPKSIKFSDVYDFGLPEDSIYTIASYFTLTGKHNEKVGMYYSCRMKLFNAKNGDWGLIRVKTSILPLEEWDN